MHQLAHEEDVRQEHRRAGAQVVNVDWPPQTPPTRRKMSRSDHAVHHDVGCSIEAVKTCAGAVSVECRHPPYRHQSPVPVPAPVHVPVLVPVWCVGLVGPCPFSPSPVKRQGVRGSLARCLDRRHDRGLACRCGAGRHQGWRAGARLHRELSHEEEGLARRLQGTKGHLVVLPACQHGWVNRRGPWLSGAAAGPHSI